MPTIPPLPGAEVSAWIETAVSAAGGVMATVIGGYAAFLLIRRGLKWMNAAFSGSAPSTGYYETRYPDAGIDWAGMTEAQREQLADDLDDEAEWGISNNCPTCNARLRSNGSGGVECPVCDDPYSPW